MSIAYQIESTHHFLGQGRVNLIAEQVPPHLQELLEMMVARWSLYLLAGWVEVLSPWLRFADEMEDFNVTIVPKNIKSLIRKQFRVKKFNYFLNAGKYEYVAVDAVLYTKGRRFELSDMDQFEKYWLSYPWSPPKTINIKESFQA